VERDSLYNVLRVHDAPASATAVSGGLR
jgi:hypothetical protein